MDGSKLLERAIEIAVRAHAGQLYPARDGERGPYVLHLFRVMLAVEGWEARSAAVLHDVIEDTPVTAAELRDEGIPPQVVDAVVALTHRPRGQLRGLYRGARPACPRPRGQARRPRRQSGHQPRHARRARPAPPASPATKPPSRASPIHIGNRVAVLCRPQGDKGQKPLGKTGAGDRFAKAAADLVGAVEAKEAEQEEDGAEEDEDAGVGDQPAEDQSGADRHVDRGDQAGRATAPTVAARRTRPPARSPPRRRAGTRREPRRRSGRARRGRGRPAGLPDRIVPFRPPDQDEGAEHDQGDGDVGQVVEHGGSIAAPPGTTARATVRRRPWRGACRSSASRSSTPTRRLRRGKGWR